MKLPEQPNCMQTWEQLWAQHEEYLNLYGTAMVWYVKNNQGEVTEAWLLNPYYMISHSARDGYPNGFYRYTTPGGHEMNIGAEHVKRTIKVISYGKEQGEAGSGSGEGPAPEGPGGGTS